MPYSIYLRTLTGPCLTLFASRRRIRLFPCRLRNELPGTSSPRPSDRLWMSQLECPVMIHACAHPMSSRRIQDSSVFNERVLGYVHRSLGHQSGEANTDKFAEGEFSMTHPGQLSFPRRTPFYLPRHVPHQGRIGEGLPPVPFHRPTIFEGAEIVRIF